MTQSTPTEAWLKEADEILAEYVKPNSLIDSGNLFHAAALYRQVITERERSAPDEQEWWVIRDRETSGSLELRGFDAAVKLIARPLLAERQELTRKGESLCQAYGVALLDIKDREKERDSARAEATQLRKELDFTKQCLEAAGTNVASLRAESERLGKRITELKSHSRVAALEEDLAEATKALEYYANTRNWGHTCDDDVSVHYDEIYSDSDSKDEKRYYGGRRAREALAKLQLGELKTGREEG